MDANSPQRGEVTHQGGGVSSVSWISENTLLESHTRSTHLRGRGGGREGGRVGRERGREGGREGGFIPCIKRILLC